MSKEKEIQALFTRFLLDQCNQEDEERVLILLQSNAYDHLFSKALDELEATENAITTADEFTRERIFRQINKKKKPVRTNLWPLSKIAASVLVLLTVGVVFSLGAYYYKNTDAFVTYHELRAPAGQIKSYKLADGSVIWLNGGSKLTYSNNYGLKDRKVTLQGEAFFQVIRHEQKPFVVATAGIETKVLGTSFNIKAYPKQPRTIITVASGKVQVSQKDTLENIFRKLFTDPSQKPPYILTPNQVLLFDKKSGMSQTLAMPAEDLIAWREGKLIFKEATYEEVAASLENRYGINVSFAEEALKKCRFTARFGKEASIHDVLDLLALVHSTNYQQTNAQTYVILGQGCN